jgi:hypothetical protein
MTSRLVCGPLFQVEALTGYEMLTWGHDEVYRLRHHGPADDERGPLPAVRRQRVPDRTPTTGKRTAGLRQLVGSFGKLSPDRSWSSTSPANLPARCAG